jgi:transposase-like protein
MTQDAFERGDWQAVIDAHQLESHDPAEWLRYGSALLCTLQPGPDAAKQQQQAALAFVQAQREGASAGAVVAAQRQAVMANLRQALELVGIPGLAEPEPPGPLRRVLLVLGMHRSGTSALAGLLCQQGFQAPLEADGGDAHNPTGYWEPRQIRAFHNSLLEAAQSSWEDPLLPVLPWQPQHLDTAVTELEQALAADFPTPDPQAVALIKDPRQCRLLPLWTALFAQRPFQVAVVLAVRQPEAVAASLVSRDQLPLDRALLLWLSHTLEAERATRRLPRLVLSYEQLLQDPAAAVQRCQQLAGLPTTTPSAELLGQWIRPALNRHQGSPEGVEPKGETKTLLQWANTVYAALVEPAAEQQRPLLDRAQAVVQEKLQALMEQGSRRVMLQLFWEPEAGGGFSESASQRRSVMVERGRAGVVFELPAGAERPRLLRLDLAEEPSMVTVLAIRLRSATGTLLWQWPAPEVLPDPERMLPVRDVNPHTLVLKGGMVLAATVDPGVVLEIPEVILKRLEAKAELELKALWQLLPLDVAEAMLESKKVIGLISHDFDA